MGNENMWGEDKFFHSTPEVLKWNSPYWFQGETSLLHSEKKAKAKPKPKRYRWGTLRQMVPFFRHETLFLLIIMFMKKRVPLSVPLYGQSNSAFRGTVSVPYFSECWVHVKILMNSIHISTILLMQVRAHSLYSFVDESQYGIFWCFWQVLSL